MLLSEPSATPGVGELSSMLLSPGTVVWEQNGEEREAGTQRNGWGGESRGFTTGILDCVGGSCEMTINHSDPNTNPCFGASWWESPLIFELKPMQSSMETCHVISRS